MLRIPTLRRTALAGLCAGGAALAVIAAPSAPASPSSDSAPSAPSAAAAALAAQNGENREAASVRHAAADLGRQAAGTYFDQSADRMVVNVTTASAARELRADGVAARVVDHSTAELTKVTSLLTNRLHAGGTAWAIDHEANRVLVSLDSSVSKKVEVRVDKMTARFGDAVKVQEVSGTFKPTVSGGQAIWTGGGRCSLGFNVWDGANDYFLTAGHCTDIGTYWYADSGQTQYLGNTVGSSFPGNDYGIVAYSGTGGSGSVYLYNGTYRDITGASNAYVGQYVIRSGSTTGVWDGYVQALNASVNYGGGDIVHGLIQTNVCAEQGDSGGSLFAGNSAIGLTSGGSGNCSTGGTTFFQPVTEALNAYGVAVY